MSDDFAFSQGIFLPDELEHLSDFELVKYAQAGDENAFAEIVRRFSPRVFRFASRYFRQRSLVEEAAQEVFLKVFGQIGNYEGRGSFEGWLTRITINTCLNLLRSAKRQPEIAVSDLSEDETNWLENNVSSASLGRQSSDEDKFVAADLVNKVLGALPLDDQLVLQMIDGDGASIKEVVKITGWSESKVKIQAFRARRKMREAIEKLLNAKLLNGTSHKPARLGKLNK